LKISVWINGEDEEEEEEMSTRVHD